MLLMTVMMMRARIYIQEEKFASERQKERERWWELKCMKVRKNCTHLYFDIQFFCCSQQGGMKMMTNMYEYNTQKTFERKKLLMVMARVRNFY